MANKTQTTTKTAAKTAPKAAPKAIATKTAQAPKAKTAAKPQAKAAQATKVESGAANIVAMIVEGIAKRIEAKSSFYMTALAYHARNKTQFPRARNNETRAALKVEDVAQVFDMHDKKILASGNAKGQAMFDVYMMQRT